MIGKNISNFYITEQLGEGGMGTVYKATDKYLERTVALKMLHPFLTRDPDYFKRFRNEAHLSAKISHPNVATLFNFEESDAHHFIVMEYVDGLPLDNILKLQGKLPEEETVKIILQILEGLGAAHDLGIMHRDLKPGNIMINRRGYVKLMDFGIARLETAERMTQQNSVIGTLEYMAPELVKGEMPSKQSDLYAVGVMMHEILSGNTLFQADSEAAMMYQIAHVAPKIQLPDTNPKLVRILKKLTHRVPGRRYNDTAEAIRDLEKIYLPGKINTALLGPKLSPVSGGARKAWALPGGIPASLAKLRLSDLQQLRMPFDIDIRIIAGAAILSLLILIIGLAPLGRRGEKGQEVSTGEMGDLTSLEEDQTRIPSLNNSGLDQPAPVKVIPFKKGEGPQQPETEEPRQEEKEHLNRPNRHVIKSVDEAASEEESASRSKENTATTDKKTSTREETTSETRQERQPQEQQRETQRTDRGEQNNKTVTQPVKTLTISIPETDISVRFTETISSERNRMGEMIFLETTRPVHNGNHMIVAPGAKIRAQIVKLRSGAEKKRAFLGVSLQAVQAVNGNWLPLEFPEYSNVSKGQVVFERGRILNNVKIIETSLTIEVQ